jgi:CxxC-x17-CxxC domain-containing protein
VPQADRPLPCRDCGSTFVFTSGEQAFYASRGLTHNPTRCPDCRSARKGNSGDSGANPLTDSGYVHYGPFASFGGRTPRQMHPATCGQCGQMTEVPFVPKGERPVLCSDCFASAKRGGAVARVTADKRLTSS